jgi:Gpi18-like mannosyltransferase
VLIGGLIARVALVLTDRLGHLPDTNLFLSWARDLGALGLARFYQERSFCDYPPVFVIVMWCIGKSAVLAESVFGSEVVLRALLKAPACLADVVIALTLLREGRRLIGPRAALAAAALYFLNPAVIYNSAYWGQVDAIHTAFLMLGFAAVGRQHFATTGLFAALAMLTKFQSIALLPLLIFDTWVQRRFRGLALFLCGGVAAASVILLPFALTGTADDVLARAYVHVVGQYHELSKNAMNLWQLFGIAELADTSPPRFIAAAAAQGAPSIALDASPLMWLTYRHISLVLYAWVVAAILSLYARRWGSIARYGAAGALALAFFFIPTEMHERYAHPALAFLAVWAVTAAWRERTFWMLSILLLLNLTLVLPINDAAVHTSAAMTVAVAAVFVLALAGRGSSRDGDGDAPDREVPLSEPLPARSSLVVWFARATWASGVVLAIASVGVVGLGLVRGAWKPPADEPGITYVSSLSPVREHQGWGKLGMDHSVSGGLIQLGDRLYFRGIGTHAPALQTFDIPEGSTTFRAVVGIDGAAGNRGSAVAQVELDGKEVFRSEPFYGGGEVVEVVIDLGGARRIGLRTEATNDGVRSDHVSWALARFE